MIWIVVVILIVVLSAGILIAGSIRRRRSIPPHKAAGDAGEAVAAAGIKRILEKGDKCFRNVTVSYGGQETELDFLIINENGVFIIEVKNYSGKINGREEDQYWEKSKISQGGKTYVNSIENPIPQIRREEYILGNYLRSMGVRVWVNGYIYFVRCNRPFKSRYLLNSGNEIELAIHSSTDRTLSSRTISRIIEVLDL